eukprot:scaffold144297_cov130-Phaeocystis_antarctica.AAC.2
MMHGRTGVDHVGRGRTMQHGCRARWVLLGVGVLLELPLSFDAARSGPHDPIGRRVLLLQLRTPRRCLVRHVVRGRHRLTHHHHQCAVHRGGALGSPPEV